VSSALQIVRWIELGLIAASTGLVAVVLAAYLRALRRVRVAGLTWLGLKIAHVVLVAAAYECGAVFIFLELWHRYEVHATYSYRIPLGLIYGVLGCCSQVAIMAYERRGGSVGAYATHERKEQ
jgi:hypothetical protein